ncbi:phosphatidylserine decarboxylase-domain-containing protein [Cytidiella melzeri]|nr:phosphatidylserine decarboxylase-domain-containing protein [Cytidiella melzeri]
MVRAPKKALKPLGRAIKTAGARIPIPVYGGKGSGRNAFSPAHGEQPVVILKVQVISCEGVLAKDKGGVSDPFVVVSLLRDRFQTTVQKKTVNPVWSPKDATFDFLLYHSLADKLGVIELVIWDKDMLKKDYLGEVSIPLDDWFRDDNPFAFDDPNNKPFSLNIVSTRTSTLATGTIQVKLGFVQPPNVESSRPFSEIYDDFRKLSRPSLVSAPPTEGIGTIRSSHNGPEFADDGLSSDEGESDSALDDDDFGNDMFQTATPPPMHASPDQQKPNALDALDTPTLAGMTKTPTPATPAVSVVPPTPISTRSQSFTKFLRRPASKRSASVDSTMIHEMSVPGSPSTPTLAGSTPPSGTVTPTTGGPRRPSVQKARFRKSWGAKPAAGFNFSAGPNDIMGIVMLEIKCAKDLPKLRNMTRTGWDMDPFVVVSFGKKVFRTRVIRHSLNPTWDEKLLFHVRRYETSFNVQLAVLDWDKLSSNDHIGDVSLPLAKLLEHAPKQDEVTQLYPVDNDGTQDEMTEFTLPLNTDKGSLSKYNSELTIRAKYQPYDALRQRFWRQYLKQYDTDDSGTISQLELTSMLDSLGSTLSRQTIESFYTGFDKSTEDTLTVDEVIQCLETELCRPSSEKKRIKVDDRTLNNSAPVTPSAMAGGELQFDLGRLDFSGPAPNIPAPVNPESEHLKKPAQPSPQPTEPMQQPLVNAAMSRSEQERQLAPNFSRHASASSSDADEPGSGESSPSTDQDSFERVINIKSCPLCHKQRMNSKAEVDIVTHMAICASQDWARVDRIVVGNFVTANQAQRKWYTKVISSVASGNYRLGANSANIIVQNRMTGQLEEEKMQVYVRLGIRLLYKGWRGRIEGGRARRLLKSMSVKQGIKYDSPESARDIPTFIEFHKLKVDEMLHPVEYFKTFNQFFYRELKPDARPVESPDDPNRLVSGADCRLMAFETVNEATSLWIKGRDFSVARLLGNTYKSEAERYNGGALCIFRLAPQDYHRFHSPVDGVIGPMTYIAGEYYTVNPQAIRTALDVYGENARKIVPIESPQFGRVMAVCVGAMMVGSIKTTVNEGDTVKRGQEFGYFAFGGSTIVVLFEKGAVEWDEDLLVNGRACLETLVRVGMGIGRCCRRAPTP